MVFPALEPHCQIVGCCGNAQDFPLLIFLDWAKSTSKNIEISLQALLLVKETLNSLDQYKNSYTLHRNRERYVPDMQYEDGVPNYMLKRFSQSADAMEMH